MKIEDIAFHRQISLPQKYNPVRVETDVADIYTWDVLDQGEPRYLVKAWVGRATNPTAHYRFANPAKRQAWVDQFIKDQTENRAYKANQKAERSEAQKIPHTLVVGSILASSWGYDQTNVDFYQVTRVVSGATVEVRKIASQEASDGAQSMTGRVVAVKDKFVGEPKQYRVRHNGVKIASYARASLWDGKPMYVSHYA